MNDISYMNRYDVKGMMKLSKCEKGNCTLGGGIQTPILGDWIEYTGMLYINR